MKCLLTELQPEICPEVLGSNLGSLWERATAMVESVTAYQHKAKFSFTL